MTLLCNHENSRLSQLPYLNAKRQYLWGAFTVDDVVRSDFFYFFLTDYLTRRPSLFPQTDRGVEVIDIGNSNTVRALRDQLARLVRTGYADTGFPILSTDANGKSRMLGFIGANELEHALSTFLRISSGSPAGHLCTDSPRSSSNSVLFFFLCQASSPRKRITPYFSIQIAGSGMGEVSLLHPYLLWLTALRIHSTSVCTWTRYIVPPSTPFRRVLLIGVARHAGSANYKCQFAIGTCAAVFRQAWGTIRCCYGRKRLL